MSRREEMDRREIEPCAMCGKGVMHTGAPFFYEVEVTQCMADMNSIQRQHGLEVMMGGNAPLAAALAPSTTVAHRLPTQRLLVCSECALMKTIPVAALPEFCKKDDGRESSQ